MSIRIITGSTGTNHVTSQDDGSLNQVILGSKSVVLDIGEKMAATVVDNNTVRISDGDILLQGRHARIDAGTVEDMTIGTGTIEMNRNDLIVARYTLNTGTGFENIELIVLEGTETSGSASDPAYNTGDIRTGSAIVDFPLYRVRIEGINIVGLVRLFDISGGANSSLIGNAYSATKSYKSGEYCIDNGIMWRSRIDNNIGNTPAENSYWTRASIANDVSTLNQNLNGFEFKVEDGVPMWKNESAGADTFAPFKGKPTLLWTNPNPNNSFGNQTIVFDKEAKSKVLLIEYKRNTTANPDLIYINTIMWDTEIKPIQYLESAGESATRRFNNPTSTSINCYQTTNNTTNIPLRIWEM